MREIKCRGTRTDNDKWAYGYYLPWHAVTDLSGNEPYAQIFEEYLKNSKYVAKGWTNVLLNTVSQYIGVKDTNRKEIYEGDIVKFNEQIGEVVFENGTFGIGFNDYINWKRLERNYKDSQIDDNILPVCYNDHFISFAEIYSICNNFDDVEVIGNIYENKDLLNQE